MAKEIICSSCGAKCLDTDNYCIRCHTPISYEDRNFGTLEGIEVEKWSKFIGKKASGYIETFRKHENKNFFLDFNPYIFLFGTYWMIYRKMYWQAICLDIISNLFLVFLYVFMSKSLVFLLFAFPVVIAYKIAISLVASCVYKKHVKKHVSKPYPNYERGGTSILAVVVVEVGISILSSLFEKILVMIASLN